MYKAKLYEETWKRIKHKKILSTTLNVVLKANIATSLLLQEFRGLLAHKTSWSSQLSSQKYSTDQFSVTFFFGSLGKHQAMMSLGKLSYLIFSRTDSRNWFLLFPESYPTYELCHQHITVHVPQRAFGFLSKGGHIFQQNFIHCETLPRDKCQTVRWQCNICIIHNPQS